MTPSDVKDTLDPAVKHTGGDHIQVRRKRQMDSAINDIFLEIFEKRSGQTPEWHRALYDPILEAKIERYPCTKEIMPIFDIYFTWGSGTRNLNCFVDYYKSSELRNPDPTKNVTRYVFTTRTKRNA